MLINDNLCRVILFLFEGRTFFFHLKQFSGKAFCGILCGTIYVIVDKI